MKSLKFALTLLTCVAILSIVGLPLFTFAQDSTSATGSATVAGLPSWVAPLLAIVYAIYELLVRFIPTAKNWSILGWVIKVLQTIIPNANSTTPTQPHA